MHTCIYTVNAQSGDTCLHAACICVAIYIHVCLECTQSGDTCLHAACTTEVECVKLLLKFEESKVILKAVTTVRMHVYVCVEAHIACA